MSRFGVLDHRAEGDQCLTHPVAHDGKSVNRQDRWYRVYGLSGASCARTVSSCSQGAFVGLAFRKSPSCHSPLLLVGRSGLGSPACLWDGDSHAPSHSASLLPLPPSLPDFNKQIVPPSYSDAPFKKLFITLMEVFAAGSTSHVQSSVTL